MQNGNVNITGKLKINFEEGKFRMLQNGLVKEVFLFGEIQGVDSGTLKCTITDIIPPEGIIYGGGTKETPILLSHAEDSTAKNHSGGLFRMSNFLHSELLKERWILFGKTGNNSVKFITVIHFPAINLTLYAIKKPDEELNQFLPEGMKYNPN